VICYIYLSVLLETVIQKLWFIIDQLKIREFNVWQCEVIATPFSGGGGLGWCISRKVLANIYFFSIKCSMYWLFFILGSTGWWFLIPQADYVCITVQVYCLFLLPLADSSRYLRYIPSCWCHRSLLRLCYHRPILSSLCHKEIHSCRHQSLFFLLVPSGRLFLRGATNRFKPDVLFSIVR